jgi:aldose sugar dehydrogenase
MKKYISGYLAMVLFVFITISCNSVQRNSDHAHAEFTSDTFTVDTLATGLENPWGMAFLPDGRILIAERPGRLRVWENGVLQPEPIGGLPEIWAHGQGGLLDVVLHPDYEQNGWLYLAYAARGEGGGNTAISRARLTGNDLVDFELLFHGQPYSGSGAHFGCRIVFDDSNYLFFTIGDRGSQNNAQRLDNHNGKVHRIYDDGRVPQDNPFINTPDAMPEIWSYGHRNIQGMIIHPETGTIWSHEHGPRGGDEINIVLEGENFGWPEATYGINYNGTIVSEHTSLPGMIDPVLQWTPSIAPCGLEVILSDKYPQWHGNLFVGALAGQHIHRVVLDSDEEVVGTEKLLQDFARFRDIREGPDGFIYVLTESPGLFFRLLPE